MQTPTRLKVLLVLDDCWEEKHAKLLNCVDADAGSACVITTRIRNLGDGEISCGLLSEEESLSLLLTSAGLDHLVDNPPAAAREAVECCGRLALALLCLSTALAGNNGEHASFDTDGDGCVTCLELGTVKGGCSSQVQRWVNEHDTSGDQCLDVDEWNAALNGVPVSVSQC